MAVVIKFTVLQLFVPRRSIQCARSLLSAMILRNSSISQLTLSADDASSKSVRRGQRWGRAHSAPCFAVRRGKSTRVLRMQAPPRVKRGKTKQPTIFRIVGCFLGLPTIQGFVGFGVMPHTGFYWHTTYGKDYLKTGMVPIHRPVNRRILHDFITAAQGSKPLPPYLAQVLDAMQRGIHTPLEFSTTFHLPIKTSRDYYAQLAQRGLIVRTIRRNGVRYALASHADLSARS